MRRSFVLFAGLLCFVAFEVLCLDGGSAGVEKLNVVVSIYPLKDMVEQVGGERVQVDFIIPPGATPHTFEPTPADMARIHNAKMLVIIGAGLEFWAEKAVKSAGRRDLKVLVLSDSVPLISETHVHSDGKAKKRATGDPHIWLDPVIAKEMVDRISSALAGLDASNADYYRKRAERFNKEIDRLDEEIAAKVKAFRIREYVTFHPAWNYFSRRYGLRVAGVIEESPGKEAGPKHIARIIREIRRTGARAVFAEPQFNPKTAAVIAREAGARVLFLDPIGSPEIKGRDTYIGLMKYNLSALEEGMK